MNNQNNNSKGIILLGLGPGAPELITREAWDVFHQKSEVYLRTKQHPAVEYLPRHLNLFSFDEIYQKAENFEDVYAQIVETILDLGSSAPGVVYAVPGSPFLAEATTIEIYKRAKEQEIPVVIVHGISFLEPVLAVLEMDAFPRMTLLDALSITQLHVPDFPPDTPVLIAQIYSKDIAANVKLTLMAMYPDEHPVKLVHAAGTDQQRVEELKLYEIDRSPYTGLLTVLYVPPLGEATSFEAFLEVVAHLRSPEGCPWDREQTHQSLRPYLLEETYELLNALDEHNLKKIREELGDLLLQIFLHTEIASENGDFTIADVLHGIHTKIVNRHPHVFAAVKVDDSQMVVRNWERLKAEERVADGNAQKSMLDGVPTVLPALNQADQYQRRVARVGFDWSTIDGVQEKVVEELNEVKTAKNKNQQAQEIGDLLFAVVNLARWYGVDPESALRETNARFKQRFVHMEQEAKRLQRNLPEMSLVEKDELWERAKREISSSSNE